MNRPNTRGKLFLIPTTLGDTPPLMVLPTSVKDIVAELDEFIVENEKSARRFIKQLTPEKSQPGLTLHLLNKYTLPEELPTFLDACDNGVSIGLMSEAGVPGIADPGAAVVKIAHQRAISVVPLVGPSSILMAMMASGMNGQNFAFNGYLPIQQRERRDALRQLEKQSREHGQSQIFIETPYRNNKMLEELIAALNDSTRLCLACDISLPTEYIHTRTIAQWKRGHPDLHKRPCIFIVQA